MAKIADFTMCMCDFADKIEKIVDDDTYENSCKVSLIKNELRNLDIILRNNFNENHPIRESELIKKTCEKIFNEEKEIK